MISRKTTFNRLDEHNQILCDLGAAVVKSFVQAVLAKQIYKTPRCWRGLRPQPNKDPLPQCIIPSSDSLSFKLKQTGLAEVVRNDRWQGQTRSRWPWLIDSNTFFSKTVLASPSAVAFASAFLQRLSAFHSRLLNVPLCRAERRCFPGNCLSFIAIASQNSRRKNESSSFVVQRLFWQRMSCESRFLGMCGSDG